MEKVTYIIGSALTIVAVAVLLTSAHGAYSVFVLEKWDPKFGVMGTVEFEALVVLLCASVAAAGAAFSTFLSLRAPMEASSAMKIVLSAAIVGSVVACTHRFILFGIPLVRDLNDVFQYCALFLLWGFTLHRATQFIPWLSGPTSRSTRSRIRRAPG